MVSSRDSPPNFLAPFHTVSKDILTLHLLPIDESRDTRPAKAQWIAGRAAYPRFLGAGARLRDVFHETSVRCYEAVLIAFRVSGIGSGHLDAPRMSSSVSPGEKRRRTRGCTSA